MGKGSRNRQVRVDDKAVNPQKYVQKKKTASKNYTSIIAVIVTVIVAAALIFGAVSASGITLRTRTTMQSDNFKVTGTMMSYFAHTVYSSFVSEYEEMYGSYLESLSSYGYTIYDMIGIDPNKSLKDQVYNESTGETWYDYFMTEAREQTEQLLLYCEGAKAAGIELDEADMQEIDSSVALLSAYASYYGYSTNSYLANLYGKGVNEKDVRNAMKLSVLATKFTEKLVAEFEEAATDADVEAFYAENTNDYLSADYLSYTFTAELPAAAEGATEEDLAAAREKYTADKAAADEAAKALQAATTEEGFREALEAYLTETMADSYKYEDYLTTAEGETDAEKEENAKKTAQEKLHDAVHTKLDAIETKGYAYNDSTDLGKWIFGEENIAAALVNTVTKIVKDSEDTEEEIDKTAKQTYTVTVYFLTRAASRDESKTYNFSYLALPGTTYTIEQAETALKEFVDAGATKEVLLGMSTKYSSHAGCTDVENAASDYFGMADVDAWTFDSERKAGDYELISGSSGDANYFFIVLSEGEGKPVWYVDVLADLIVSKNNEWLEDAAKTYPVKVNEKAVNAVKM